MDKRLVPMGVSKEPENDLGVDLLLVDYDQEDLYILITDLT